MNFCSGFFAFVLNAQRWAYLIGVLGMEVSGVSKIVHCHRRGGALRVRRGFTQSKSPRLSLSHVALAVVTRFSNFLIKGVMRI